MKFRLKGRTLKIEGIGWNVEFVRSHKTLKDFASNPMLAEHYINFKKEDRESLLKKVYDECNAPEDQKAEEAKTDK